MKWLWLLISIVPIIMAISRSRKNRKAQHNLQFWNADSGLVDDELKYYELTVHFPSMLLKWQHGDHA